MTKRYVHLDDETKTVVVEPPLIIPDDMLVGPEDDTHLAVPGVDFHTGQTWVECEDTNVVQGWVKQANGSFAAPPPPPAPPPQTIFAPRAFVGLFTPAEQTALFTARQTNVQVDQFITLAMAGPVDLTNAEVIADVNAVAEAGIVTTQRAAQILAGTPAPTG